MMKRTILILSLLLGHLWQSHGQVMMLFSSDSLVNITSPLDIDSLFYWFAADVGVTDSLGGAIATNEGVGTWADLSGNNYNATQTTNGARPVWKATGGPGSKPCIQSDGSNDIMGTSNHFWGSDDITVLVVAKVGNAALDVIEVLCGKSTAGSNKRQWAAAAGQTTAGSNYGMFLRAFHDGGSFNYVTYNDGAKEATWRAWTFISNGAGTTTMHKDGASQSVTRNVTGTGNDTVLDANDTPFSVFGNNFGTLNNNLLQGSISEIIVYSRALTTAERTAIENYLNKKYDLY